MSGHLCSAAGYPVSANYPLYVLFDQRGTTMYNRDPHDDLPDVRDGLTSREHLVLRCLHGLQKERGDRYVPTGMLYGSVGESLNMRVEEM
jgi:hypothetical protein